MPIFTVTAPDGRTYDVNAPEGATQEQAFEYVRQNHYGGVDPEPKKTSRSAMDVVRDVGVTALKGAVALPEAIVGLADIPTGGRVGKALEDVGVRFGDTQKILGDQYSEAQQEANRKVQEADGFVDTTVAALENPSTIATAIGESIPQMIGGAGLARLGIKGAVKLGAKVSPWLAGAVGEGTIAAGSAAEGMRQESADKLLSGKQTVAALGSGAGTAALGALGGKLAQKFKFGDMDTILAQGGPDAVAAGAAKKGFMRQVAEGGISEGVFEEMPQSIQETMWQNWAGDKPLMEGTGNAAAMGMLAGLGMGMGGGGYNAAMNREDSTMAPSPEAAPTVEGGDPPTTTPPSGPLAGQDDGRSYNQAAQDTLTTPRNLTALDRVTEIDSEETRLKTREAELSAENGYGEMFDKDRQDIAARRAELYAEREAITKTWPASIPGKPVSFSTETGARLEGQYALMEADDLVASHDENLRPSPTYPPALQPRARDRAASEMQISGIVQKLDPARLGESADAATGAPIVGADGLVESGNARTIALKRAYQAKGLKADSYREFLRANADRFGLDAEAVTAMRRPVLVRVRSTPVDRAEFARQANASTVAQMSPSEQARADSARMDTLDDLTPDDNGDFTTGTSRDFVRRFLSKLPGTEQAGMIDATGQLSQSGYSRIRNAVLAKAYGDSPVLLRMVESLDDNTRNLSKALMQAAPTVAKSRQAIQEGVLFDADITPDLMSAVEELSRLKDDGASVRDALAQTGMFGERYSPETRELLQFLADNMRRPRKIAEFIQAYFETLEAAGNPNQGSLLGDALAPAKSDLMNAARRTQDGPEDVATTQGAGRQAGKQSGIEKGGSNGAQGNDAKDEWVAFPPNTGTLGIPRAEMPQIKGEHRGALIQFLQGRGITHETVDMPADQLKPTQAEFSTKKVQGWAEKREGVDRSVLASSDGYILDGHHQWVSALAAGETEKVIRFNVPIRELIAAVKEFPSVQQSEGSGDARAEKIDRLWNEALGDLGVIMRNVAGVQRMLPEDTPNLMPTLVKLFESGIYKVGYSMKDLVRYVKSALKGMDEFRAAWNKIPDSVYQKAASQAIGNIQGGQGDLFSQAGPVQQDMFSQESSSANVSQKAEKVVTSPERAQETAKPEHEAKPGNTITLDGKEYDLDAPNFGLDPWPNTLAEDHPLLRKTNRLNTVLWDGKEQPREVMREALVERALIGAKPVTAKRRPIAYVMGGGGASGKGTIKSLLIKNGRMPASGAVAIDPDEIKEDIPEYQQIKDAGDSRGAATVHEESSDIGKRIKARAMAGGYDMILDITLGNKEKGIKYIQDLQSSGYEVRLFGVSVNPLQAVIRADKRARKSFRFVPVDHLLMAHKGFSSAFEEYARLMDYATLFDNSNKEPIVAADKVMGAMHVIDQQAYNGIAERRNINERADTLREVLGNSGREAGRVSERIREEKHGGHDGQLERHPRRDSRGFGDPRESHLGNDGTGSGQRKNLGAVNDHAQPDRGENEGRGAEPASAIGSIWKSESAPGRLGGRDDQQHGDAQDGNSQQAGVQSGAGLPEAGGNPEQRPASRDGNRPKRTGVPAGRDIPAKSGRNYRFGDDDLTYQGSWIKKAEQNVEAVELLKKLQQENRQATREEQATLARFVGWGASDLANNLFGTKLDKQLELLSKYDIAIQAMNEAGRDYLEPSGWQQQTWGRSIYKAGDPNFRDAFDLLRAKDASIDWYTHKQITKAMIDAARPGGNVRKWAELRDRMKAVMSDAEWSDAEGSTINAHYTSKSIVKAMWRGIERMGFKGGAILEPGAGIGVFPGLMSPAMATNSSYTGIELDAITGGILKQLFPDERIAVESFVDSALPDEFYDVAAGNPPFANIKILADTRYRKLAPSLHDYFFMKTLDKVKPGGLVMFVTSRYTMDKINDKARQYLAERADLVGAIRLPQTAFKQNAGTDVVTDVLFLRKKVSGETFDKAQSWGKVAPISINGRDFQVNEYYHAHPEMVLGTHSDKGSMANSPDPQYTVEPNEGDIEALFDKAVDSLPENIYRATGEAAMAAKVREIDFNPKAKKEGNYYLSDAGVLMQVEGGVGVRAENIKPKMVELVRDYIPLRDAVKQAQYDQLNDGPWEASIAAMQKAYQAFVKTHGNLLQFTTRRVATKDTAFNEETGKEEETQDEVTKYTYTVQNLLADDPDSNLVMALESINEETGVISTTPALSERVLMKPRTPKIETPHDALLSVLNDTGQVDIDMIAKRLGMDRVDTVAALGTAVYETPGGKWQMADEYLSGNVRKKLAEARKAAESDRRFERNVQALTEAQPSPLTQADINVSLGQRWIAPSVIERFMREVVGVRTEVFYNDRLGGWTVDKGQAGRRKNPETGRMDWATTAQEKDASMLDWGTTRAPAHLILEYALNASPVRIMVWEGSGKDAKEVFSKVETDAAIEKVKKMREAFKNWVWTDDKRADELAHTYNDKFNVMVARKFDGRHLTMPGASSLINVFDHVKRGAWRIVQDGNTYLAHAVGSGKTWQMVISAMEQKRLGLVSKPMIVVPNHMLQQFKQEWLQLYPAASLMVADEKQFHTDNRRRFVARAAMSDLDGIIITHSAFKLLDLDPEFKRGMINQELDVLRAALEEEGVDADEKSRDPKVKEIQKRIKNYEQKLHDLTSSEGKDKSVRFDEMGVDFLYVDEAHEFRKLAFSTTRQVKGISSSGSERAFDLWMKTRWLEQKKPGRNLVMASGTPVTNTMAELYSVQKFMDYATLEEQGLERFDDWAAQYGEEDTQIEADAAGAYAPVTRFAKFHNVPELTQAFRQFADVLTSEHLAEMLGDKRPQVDGGARKLVVTPRTDQYEAFNEQDLKPRLEISRKWKPSFQEQNNPDPIIRIIGDGRLAAIDMRFMEPSLPSDPGSKLNQLIDGVIRVYKESANLEYLDKKGNIEAAKGATQMVFSDLGFGEGVANRRGFNARAWFEKRLRDAGIPMNQVAFMSDYKKSVDKVNLFRDVNSGKVRVLIGSSKNMGTGVNAQQRLIALHHLDTPWYPADLEQREGRIIRQGNKNSKVQVYAYSTKGSYDQVMWQLLARKQKFIEQALSGDSSVRTLDDVSESGQYAMAVAMTAGDPDAINLAGARADIEKYLRLQRHHEENRVRMRTAYGQAQNLIDITGKALPDVEKLAAKVQDLSGDHFKAKAGGKEYDARKEWSGALLDILKDRTVHGVAGSEKIGEISGFDVKYLGKAYKNAHGVVDRFEASVLLSLGDKSVVLALGQDEDLVGMSMRATNAMVALKRQPDEMRQAVADAKSRMVSLESRMNAPFEHSQALADKIKEAAEIEARLMSKNAQPVHTEQDGETKLSRRDSLAVSGIAKRDLSAVVARVRKSMTNLPAVHVLGSPADLDVNDPGQQRLREFIENAGAMEDAEGATHEGEIYLFASGLEDEARAEHVLATHETTHYGLRAVFGPELDTVLGAIWANNAQVRQRAKTLRDKHGMASNLAAVEEILAEMEPADLVKLKGWRRLVLKVRDWLGEHGFKALSDRLTEFLNGTMDAQAQADLIVADLVRRAREFVRNGPPMSGGMMGNMAGTMLSRAKPASDRANDIIAKKSGTPRPLDAVMKGATQAVRLDKVTGAIYDKAGFFLDRFTPEHIKAGLVADYGIPEAVLDQRATMSGRMRVQLRKTGELIDTLATLTREESRIAYQWMNSDDPQSSDYLMEQLPPESIKTMAEVERMIDKLSQEAVALKQLDPETFKRNRFAYLRRSYVKHTAELTKGEQTKRARAISILGDQYKGRGMTEGVEMKRIQNVAPEWWKRKLQAGKADKGLKGEKFIRLEKRANTGAGTVPLAGMTGRPDGKLLAVAYWPAGEPIPARLKDWNEMGTWEVRDTKGDKLVMWRDFTAQERQTMGEIDEARYAIAKTLHGMIHDVEVGNYLEWLAHHYGKKDGSGLNVVEASERMRDTFGQDEWVQVPDTKIQGTNTLKYGLLAGRYLPGPIWNDVRQVTAGQFRPLGDTYAAILRAWKTSKTVLSPGVHTNNIMANMVMADWHDVSAGHMLKALRLMLGASDRDGKMVIGRAGNLASRAGVADREAAKKIIDRFQDSGGNIGTWATAELQREQLEPLLEALEKEIATGAPQSAEVGVMAALQHAMHLRFPSAFAALAPTKVGKAVVTEGKNMIALYEAEDQVFRLAAWLKAKEDGLNDLDAGKVARKSFLDYNINAPWIQMVRQTALPFIAFTYRAAPMLIETAAKKPWKLMKLGLMVGALNALGYALSGGDEDDERKLLPEEKAGSIWGMVPKLVRMPWNDANGEPVFLDIRRWVPVGDVFDLGQNHAAIPVIPAAVPGGPLALFAELMMNKSQFTGKPITKETDTGTEKASAVLDHLYKAFAPNIVALPGTYAFTGVMNAGGGRTDSFGREQSLAQAIATAHGVKLGSYPKDQLMLNESRAMQSKLMEIKGNITTLKREYARKGINAEEFKEGLDAQMEKQRKVLEDYREKVN